MDVHANGIRINCRIDGPNDGPWVVFSNSLATNLSMWDEQVAKLAKSFRVLRYDQRGHGGTEATAGPYSLDLLTDDLAALLDSLSIGSARVVGISMGGVTVLNLAARRPERVDRVVACDCNGFATAASAQQWQERIALARSEGMERLVEPTIGRWFPADFVALNPPVLETVRTMIRTTPVGGFTGCAAALANFDLRPLLSSIRCPVRFIGGSKDASISGLRQLHAALTGSNMAEIEGAGHLSNLEQPEVFTATLQRFLSE